MIALFARTPTLLLFSDLQSALSTIAFHRCGFNLSFMMLNESFFCVGGGTVLFLSLFFWLNLKAKYLHVLIYEEILQSSQTLNFTACKQHEYHPVTDEFLADQDIYLFDHLNLKKSRGRLQPWQQDSIGFECSKTITLLV